MVESWIFKSIPNTQQRKSENVHFKTTRSTIKKKTEVFTGLAPDRFPSCSACLIAVLLFDINFVQFLKWHVSARNKTFLKLKFFCFYSHIITFMCAIILCKIIIFTDSLYADSTLSIRRFRSCFDKNLQTPKGPTTISPVPHYHTLVRFEFECDYTNELLTNFWPCTLHNKYSPKRLQLKCTLQISLTIKSQKNETLFVLKFVIWSPVLF